MTGIHESFIFRSVQRFFGKDSGTAPFKQISQIGNTTNIKYFYGDGTTSPNGNLTGNKGDKCFLGDNKIDYICIKDSSDLWIPVDPNIRNWRQVTDTDVTVNEADQDIYVVPETTLVNVTMVDATLVPNRNIRIHRDIDTTDFRVDIYPGFDLGQNINQKYVISLQEDHESIDLSSVNGNWRSN